MEYILNLNGRPFADLVMEKQKALQNRNQATLADWCALAALILEVIGVRNAVRLGDSRLWRQAITECSTAPLPPLNLPLLLWEAYQAEEFTICKQDGEVVEVPSWAHLSYCWQTRKCIVWKEKGVEVVAADEIVGVEAKARPGPQIAIVERLQWLQKATHFAPFAIRTSQGIGFLISKRNSFQLDESCSLLVINVKDGPQRFIRVADVVAVKLPNCPTETFKRDLLARMNSSPFISFHIHALHGGNVTISSLHELLLTDQDIIVGTGSSDNQIMEASYRLPWTGLDRIEAIPSEAAKP